VPSETPTVIQNAPSNRAAQGELPRDEMLREWLGVETAEPSHYGLLGVPELETDEKAILEAARRVKRKVRAYQIGLYRKQALGLLAEVGQAVSTLTNPQKKRVYDNGLMAGWREQAEALAREHLAEGDRSAQTLEAWLGACRERRIPVTRLMPYLMKRAMVRVPDWPKVGVHEVPVPVALWTYRDVAVLGQCLKSGTLEKRVDAVKKAQRMLAVPPTAARLVAEEVGRAVDAFSRLRLVRQAQDDPEQTLLRFGRRIRRYGGELGKGKVLAAAARVLGKTKADLDEALTRIDEPVADMSRGRVAARAARRASTRVRGAGERLAGAPSAVVEWVADRPQILLPMAVVAGLVSLVLAVLSLVGAVKLWQPDQPAAPDGMPAAVPGVTAEKPEPQTPDSGQATVLPLQPNVQPFPEPVPEGPPDWLEQFRKKYPATRPPAPKTEEPPSDVEFFGVKGEKRMNGSPVEVKSKKKPK